MDAAGIYQMGSLLLVEALQIGDMLEIVAVDLSAFHYLVGKDIVIKFLHFQCPSLLCQNLGSLFQDLRMGSG